jgi:hypothetical protein
MPYANYEDQLSYNRRYSKTPKYRAYQKEHRNRPEQAAKNAARQVISRSGNPGKIREYGCQAAFMKKLKRRGFTPIGYIELWRAQGRQCGGGCGRYSPGTRGWHLDHDHVTNKVRGILCHNCNLGLGNSQDNPDLLRSWAAYVERHQ